MKGLNPEQIAAAKRRNLSRAPHELEMARDRNLQAMTGRSHEKTVREWSRQFGVTERTIRGYAKEIGEKCKRAPYKRSENGSRYTKWLKQSEDEQASMMTKWASIPITARSDDE